MSNYQAIIFDLDGTLIDSVKDIADAANSALEQRGFPLHSYEEYRGFIGHGLRNLCQRSLPERFKLPIEAGSAGPDRQLTEEGQRELDICHRILMDTYRAHPTDKTVLYPGIERVLEHARSKGIRMAVLSNKADELTQKILCGLGVDSFFKVITGLRDGFARKPDPASTLWVLRQLQDAQGRPLAKEKVLYVGDSAVDMQTAKAAGLDSVACSWGFRPLQELEEQRPTWLIHRPESLIDLLEGKLPTHSPQAF